jgi:oligosaccharyltransferase complex subunit alpha (ribophorin I)
LKIQAIFTNLLEPYPKEIYQKDNQLVRFIDSHYFLSPYKTITQKTTIKLATNQIESYTKLVPYSSRGSNIIFGSYKEIKPFEVSLY